MGIPETSVVIPARNRLAQTKACLESLFNMEYSDFEVIVVDDASDDASPDKLKKLFPAVNLVRHKECRGAAEARNTGIAEASGKYLCFVDNDNVVDKDFLGNLVALAAGDKEIGCVAPKMYYLFSPRRVYFAGAKHNMITSMTKQTGQGRVDDGSMSEVIDVDCIPNAYLMKRDVIDKIGLFDSYYEMFYEDMDWFYRARSAGYRVVLCPDAITYHDIAWRGEKPSIRSITGCDTNRRAYLLMRNRTVFMRRYSGLLQFVVYCLIFLPILTCGYSTIYIRFGRFDYAMAAIRGMFRGLYDAFKQPGKKKSLAPV